MAQKQVYVRLVALPNSWCKEKNHIAPDGFISILVGIGDVSDLARVVLSDWVVIGRVETLGLGDLKTEENV